MPAAGDVHYLDGRGADGARARGVDQAARPGGRERRDGRADAGGDATRPRPRRPRRRRPRRRRRGDRDDDRAPATTTRRRRRPRRPATTTAAPATTTHARRADHHGASTAPTTAPHRDGPTAVAGGASAPRAAGLAGGAARAPHRPALRRLPRAPARSPPARARLAGHRQGLEPRQRRAPPSRSADWTLPARRGTIVDRHGIELAVSEPADDVSATPYLVKDPAATARASSRRCSASTRGRRSSRKLATRDTGFVYLARQLPAGQGRAVQKLQIARHRSSTAGAPARLPAPVAGRAGARHRRHRRRRPERASSTPTTSVLQGTDGERRLVKDALGQPISIRDTKPAKAGARLELTLDAAIQDKVEGVLADVGATYRPKGATAIVMDPHTGEVLAMANWPRVDANDAGRGAQLRHAGPRRRLHLRAGLDVQGLHRRRARCRTAWSRRTRRSTSPPQIQVADRDDRRVARPRPRDADDRADPRAVLATSARSRSACAMGKRALRPLGAQVRLRQADRRRPARRGARPRAARRQVLGLVDGQPADRPGPVGDADADGRRPTRRSPTAAILRSPRVVRRVDGKLVRPARRASASSRPRPPPQLRTMLEGVFAPGRHGERGLDPRLQARGQDRHGEQDRPGDGRVLEVALRRLVRGLRAGAAPEAADRR